ncbi:MAG: hypothetical protein ACREA7_07865 [Nitrosotalea sp.]
MGADYASYAIGALALIVAVVLPLALYRKGKGDLTKMKKDLRDGISTDVVDVANAQLRVKDGGKVAKREGKVGADVERSVKEQQNVGENVTFVKKSERTSTENVPVGDSVDAKVTEAKNIKFVAENKKEFIVDAILINEQDKNTIDNAKKTGDTESSENKKTLQEE